jgi:hypothetical protein
LPESEPDGECVTRLDSEHELEPEPAAVEPHRSAQGRGDVAQALRAPALPAPVRLRGHSSAASFAPLASPRPSGRVAACALLTMLGAVAIVALAMTLRARHERELPELRQELELNAAQRSPAPNPPEPAPPVVLTPGPASAPTSTALAASPARAASTARAARPATQAIPATSDIVDPWRHR